MDAVDTREQEKFTAVNVRLRAVEQSDQPIMSNFATVTVAQGIAYLDFGFIEPALLAKVMVDSQNGQALPEYVEGKPVVRSASDSMCWHGCSTRCSRCLPVCGRRRGMGQRLASRS